MRQYAIRLKRLDGSVEVIPCEAETRGAAEAIGEEIARRRVAETSGFFFVSVKCLRQESEEEMPVVIAGQMSIEEE